MGQHVDAVSPSFVAGRPALFFFFFYRLRSYLRRRVDRNRDDGAPATNSPAATLSLSLSLLSASQLLLANTISL